VGKAKEKGKGERALQRIRLPGKRGSPTGLLLPTGLFLGGALSGGEKRKHQVKRPARAHDLSALLLKEMDYRTGFRGKGGVKRDAGVRRETGFRRKAGLRKRTGSRRGAALRKTGV
jgi:hypothetical protein